MTIKATTTPEMATVGTTSSTNTASGDTAASGAVSAGDAPRSYVDGPLAPVREEITSFDLPVTGQLPEALTGRYARIGPNPIDPDPATQHWFTGDGMVHGVRLAGGRAEWYRNRYVRTPDVSAALGKPEIPPLPGREDQRGTVNTNVITIDGRTLALVEAGSAPVELTDELETVGPMDFGGTLGGAFTAHPHRDPRTGLWHAVTYYWPEESVRHLTVGPDATVHRDVEIPVGSRPMAHDCAITETQVLIFDLPVTFDVDAAMAGVSFPYRWDPQHPARVGLLPLDGAADDVRWCEVPQCYVFHTMNAFDLPGGGVVVDVIRWPKVFDADRLGPSEGTPRLERWTLDPTTGTTSVDVIDERSTEFPRVDERRLGTSTRYGYAPALPVAGAARADLLRYDLQSGGVDVIAFGESEAAQEFVMVGAGDHSGEDDGWLLGFVSDRARRTTDLVVLAAADPASGPVARVHLPARVPDGFHGNWLPDRGA